MLPDIEAVNVFSNGTATMWILDHNLDETDFMGAQFLVQDMNISFFVGQGRETNESLWANNATYYPK